MKSVHIPDDEELLVVGDELRHKFAEQGERRISSNDVRLLQKFHVGEVGRTTPFMIWHLVDFYRVRFFALGLQPLDVEERQLAADDGRLHIARRDELFETERIEVEREIPAEMALKRVVTVAENRLSA